MISHRVSLSRDKYSAGVLTIGASGASALFTPLNLAVGEAPTTPPQIAGVTVPVDTLPAILADRLFVSNPGAHPIVVRPVIPGSAEAPEYPYPRFANAQGATSANATWVGFAPSKLAAAPTSATGITVPAGALAFPIEVACIGLVISGTTGDTLSYAAYGTPKRA